MECFWIYLSKFFKNNWEEREERVRPSQASITCFPHLLSENLLRSFTRQSQLQSDTDRIDHFESFNSSLFSLYWTFLLYKSSSIPFSVGHSRTGTFPYNHYRLLSWGYGNSLGIWRYRREEFQQWVVQEGNPLWRDSIENRGGGREEDRNLNQRQQQIEPVLCL